MGRVAIEWIRGHAFEIAPTSKKDIKFVDLVEHGVNGYIFDTLPEAVSHIKFLSDNPDLVVSMVSPQE